MGYHVTERQTRTAHVGEDLGEGEPGWASGKFSVHWEDRSGDWHQGPEGTDADKAIDWGRQHADVVLVRVMGAGVLYSAGVREPKDEDTEPWPERGLLIRPRPIGTPLDGSVRERAWDVEARLHVVLPDADSDQLIERVERDSRLSGASIEKAADGHSALARYSFVARDLTAAVMESEDLLAAALHEINSRYGKVDLETSAEYGG